ncbi:FAD/FMN-containing dehydrogenase [Saccharopolyspora erythraea NRRL 2338]|uniref:D-lactate dehydrogenase (Cytochrome) n=3 Tax=Saccharopolyspora erythraea TaxID=1836 RepID=A4FG84_SACEN|nr:FAD-binding and (Fe-S)-binding domain-containing protein [Saccharopolyspora erythraea]PFG96764.1 FAD/FMN-containing dehydrogenase [Saccharopolyspora erythraea NRRL 2338]QRK87013.1 FAD-binding oxidoreductase [Saccharopolyspora erythraea]CAM03059.1 D-lactate dehydrogenase (cytochrome) [Saccharopolyspora erythraea NRRL 2338]
MQTTTQDFAADLRAALRGPARFDPGTRALYSTDASNYRQVPAAVAYPRDEDDVAAAVAVARAHRVPVTGRGAGTSIAGNAVGPGLVLDFSKHMNRILELDPERRLARVQPGVVLDSLRVQAAPHGLTFGPDPSTHSRCTLGGMIGNNSCGTHSVAWGKTVDNVRSLDVLLSDGTRLQAGPTTEDELTALCARGDRTGRLYQDLRALRDDLGELVRGSFPDLRRRVSGYNLDQLLPENGFDLARALVGTEGSCATVLGATVHLVETPGARAMAVLGFPDSYAAADQVTDLRGLDALAIEGLSSELVEVVGQRNPSSPALRLLPGGRSWLLVEVGGADRAEAEAAAQRIARAMGERAETVVHVEPTRMAALWKIREEGSGYSTRLADGTERWSGWEDAAVPPEHLGAYLREFDALLERFGRRGVTYGHYGDGCIHVRIDFDLMSTSGAADYRSFLESAADLVVSHGGSVSGEHGDGQARSELLSRMYPPEIIGGFERFKAAFDPDDLFNPGQIVRPRPLDSDLRVLVAPPRIPTRTTLALHADDGDLAPASRRCVGMGKCLNTTGGVMCPSYRATREEKHSTRGRAHLLFEMLAGRVITGGWRSPEVREALDLCLSCKGCKTDCPVGVDMATYKAEFLHHHYRHRPRPASHYSMGFLPLWLALGQHTPRLANRVLTSRAAGLLKRMGGIAPERAIPPLAGQTLRAWWSARDRRLEQPSVVLFPDTFTNHFDPHVGQDAVTAMEALGQTVDLPRSQVCCGLTWASTGQLGIARRMVRRTARVLGPQVQAGLPVVGLEPSCTAFLRNDALELAPHDPHVTALAEATRTFAEWVEPTRAQWTRESGSAPESLVQVHCHQYSELGFDADRAALEATGTRARVLDSGCCGLAGNFGFERGHYEVSMACAEHALLPAVRAAEPGTDVVADGFSCRTQLRQATGTEPVHLATLVARALTADTPPR